MPMRVRPIEKFPEEFFALLRKFESSGEFVIEFETSRQAKATRYELYSFFKSLRAAERPEAQIADRLVLRVQGSTLKGLSPSSGNEAIPAIRRALGSESIESKADESLNRLLNQVEKPQ